MNPNHTGQHALSYDDYTHDYKDDLPFYESMVTQDDEVLEVGVGTGRLALRLAGRVRSYTGVDPSIEMLGLARKKLAGQNIDLHLGFMESFELPKQFSVILCPFRVFQYVEGREKQFLALMNLRRHLKPGGKIILACFPFSESYAENWNNRHFDWEFLSHDNLQWMKRDHMSFDLKEQKMKRLAEFYRAGELVGVNDESLWWLSESQFLGMLSASDLKLAARFGGFQFGPPAPGREDVWILAKQSDVLG